MLWFNRFQNPPCPATQPLWGPGNSRIKLHLQKEHHFSDPLVSRSFGPSRYQSYFLPAMCIIKIRSKITSYDSILPRPSFRVLRCPFSMPALPICFCSVFVISSFRLIWYRIYTKSLPNRQWSSWYLYPGPILITPPSSLGPHRTGEFRQLTFDWLALLSTSSYLYNLFPSGSIGFWIISLLSWVADSVKYRNTFVVFLVTDFTTPSNPLYPYVATFTSKSGPDWIPCVTLKTLPSLSSTRTLPAPKNTMLDGSKSPAKILSTWNLGLNTEGRVRACMPMVEICTINKKRRAEMKIKMKMMAPKTIIYM